MPTIKIINGVRFYFYSNEGKRAHIHVEVGGFETQVWLDDLSVKKSSLDKRIDKKILVLVEQNRDELLEAWNEFFGV